MSPDGDFSYPMCPDIVLLKSIGQDARVYRYARLLRPEMIEIGNSVIIDDLVALDGGLGTTIGDFTHLAGHGLYAGGGKLTVGNFCGLSGGICVYTGSDDFVGLSMGNPTIPYPFRQPKRSFVRIGDHVQIGANSVVLPGVTIGEGAAIGAMSLVLHDCEPWTIYAGVPARALRARPRERILELEAQLRQVAYDEHGAYLPKERWRWKEEGRIVRAYPLYEELAG